MRERERVRERESEKKSRQGEGDGRPKQNRKPGISGRTRAEQSINGETLEWKVGKERLGKRASVREIHGYHSVVINILQ